MKSKGLVLCFAEHLHAREQFVSHALNIKPNQQALQM